MSVAFSESDFSIFKAIAEQSAFALYNAMIYPLLPFFLTQVLGAGALRALGVLRGARSRLLGAAGARLRTRAHRRGTTGQRR